MGKTTLERKRKMKKAIFRQQRGSKSNKKELLKAIVVLPGTVLILIPVIILYLTQPLNFLFGFEFPKAWAPFGMGMFFVFTGILLAWKTVSLFFTVGDGTPAPWAPPRHFVAKGPYRYVRNPMIISVLLMLLGETIFFGSFPILIWCIIFWIMNTIYFIWFEEPSLVLRFGNDYKQYKKKVRRWLPRLTPWYYEGDLLIISISKQAKARRAS
jgi:protein-S-isoprenylcysteine O-methyltransferase Ste14